MNLSGDEFSLHDLPKEYLSGFRDGFFLIDSEAQILDFSVLEDKPPYLKTIGNLTEIFPSILSHLKKPKRDNDPLYERAFLENNALGLWGEVFPLEEKLGQDTLYLAIIYHQKSTTIFLDLIRNKPQEFFRSFLHYNTKKNLVFINELEAEAETIQDVLAKNPAPPSAELKPKIEAILQRIKDFRSFHIQQNKNLQKQKFDDASFDEPNSLPFSFLFSELRKYLQIAVTVNEEKDHEQKLVLGNQFWLSYAVKHLAGLILAALPQTVIMNVAVRTNRQRGQFQLEFDFNELKKQQKDEFFGPASREHSLYQECSKIVSMNYGHLKYIEDRKILELSLPMNSRRIENDEISFLIGDSDLKSLQLIREILTQNYNKVRKFEVKSYNELITAATEMEPDCILFNPFLDHDDTKSAVDNLQVLLLNQVHYNPQVIIYAEHEQAQALLQEITDSYAVSFLRKDSTKLECQVFMSQIINSARSLKVMKDLAQTARKASEVDKLTGAYNRAFYDVLIKKEISNARDQRSNLHLILSDIDFFKNYNDQNGHLAGDQLLREFVSLLKDNVRSTDYVLRYGGEEFVIVLFNVPESSVLFITEKIRAAVENYKFAFEAKQPNGNLTASFGVASYPEDGQTPEALFHTADKRLYTAKKTGRNRIVYKEKEQWIDGGWRAFCWSI